MDEGRDDHVLGNLPGSDHTAGNVYFDAVSGERHQEPFKGPDGHVEGATHEESDSQREKEAASKHEAVTGILLPRQFYIVCLVVIYSAMFITAYSILAMTSRHPIGRASYSCDSAVDYTCPTAAVRRQQNARTQTYISNAQTLMSAVALLTIPLTSTVCAAAAVPWLQRFGHGMSLRQTTALADRGWTSPYIFSRLTFPRGWRRYGSSFLAMAIILHALGAGLSPTISKLSAVVAIKVPTTSATIRDIVDLDGLLKSAASGGDIIQRLRDGLRTTSPTEYQARLWEQRPIDCNDDFADTYYYGDNPSAAQCLSGGLSYATIPDLQDPWISQLPSDFNTGIIVGQYIPRVNSSVTVTKVTDLPADCRSDHAALSIFQSGYVTSQFTNDTTNVTEYHRDSDWTIHACIVDYAAQSPFKVTTEAQTIKEVLYLDLYTYLWSDNLYRGKYKIEVSTTLGYFELPNYSLLNEPGELLRNRTNITNLSSKRKGKRDDGDDGLDDLSPITVSTDGNATAATFDLETMENKGPLLNIAFALFGNGSYPATFASSNDTYNTGYLPRPNPYSNCRDIAPLSLFVSEFDDGPPTSGDGCMDNWDLHEQVGMHLFVRNLVKTPATLTKVFQAASYMSHEFWLSTTGAGSYDDGVRYDMGVDFQKPGLSSISVIALSLAIALFLLCLGALAVYASVWPAWTPSLDAYAMLRIGADLGNEVLPFIATETANKVAKLDELPGFVGDISSATDTYGVLGMGYARPVRAVTSKRKYQAIVGARRGFGMRLLRGVQGAIGAFESFLGASRYTSKRDDDIA